MPKHPGGAPRKPFNWNLLDSLAIVEADLKYVAERMIIEDGKEPNKKNMDAKMRLINHRLKERFELSYLQYREQKKEPKRIKLRQLMWKSAEAGNITMQIWLSKNILGYTDKVEQVTENNAPQRLIIEMEPKKTK